MRDETNSNPGVHNACLWSHATRIAGHHNDDVSFDASSSSLDYLSLLALLTDGSYLWIVAYTCTILMSTFEKHKNGGRQQEAKSGHDFATFFDKDGTHVKEENDIMNQKNNGNKNSVDIVSKENASETEIHPNSSGSSEQSVKSPEPPEQAISPDFADFSEEEAAKEVDSQQSNDGESVGVTISKQEAIESDIQPSSSGSAKEGAVGQ
jgi:hypothetical protein